MQDINPLEYGVALGAIAVLAFVVRLFISHIEKKDTSFTGVISNHLTHATEAQGKLSASIDRNTEATNKLSEKIDRKL